MEYTPIHSTGILMYPPITPNIISLDFRYVDCREQTRFFVTYFDRVCAVPLRFSTGILPTAYLMSQELQILIGQNLIGQIPDRVVNISMNGGFVTNDLESVFNLANQNSDLQWAIGRPVAFRADRDVEFYNSIVMTMRDLLPVPSLSVPIHEVIDFRVENAELLKTFHIGVDSLFAGIIDNPNLQAHRLSQIVKDIEASLEKARFPFFKVGLSVSQTISEHMVAPLLEIVGQSVGAPAGAGFLIGGLFEFTIRKSSNAIRSNNYPRDFEYVYLGKTKFSKNDKVDKDDISMVTGIGFHNNSFVMGYFNEIVPETDIDFASFGSVPISGSFFG